MMTLAKALKVKNRLVKKISDLQVEIQTENSHRTDSNKTTDVELLMGELSEAVKELIKLKISIFVASTPMRENILTLSEEKSAINFLTGIDTTEGKQVTYRSEKEIEYSAAYDKAYVKKEIKKKEDSIDLLQEQLDQFSHKTEIEI